MTNAEKARREFASPLFESCQMISENMLQINFYSPVIYLAKPLSIGVSILELSIMTMYSYYYHVLKNAYSDFVELLYTDTDSLICKITSSDIDSDISHISHTLDLSNFPKNHPLYNNEHASQLFYMKMEMPECDILSGVFLKAKCYALLLRHSLKQGEGSSDYLNRGDYTGELKKCKGVASTAIRSLKFESYLDSLLQGETYSAVYNKLQSKRHTIHQVREQKMALNSCDDKRYLLDCKIHTLPYGSKHITSDAVCDCSRLG